MKRLGVLGTLVWDRIHRHEEAHRAGPIEEWGGIAYSLAALAAARPPDWEIVPLIKVGADLRLQADAFLRSLPGLSMGPGVRTVSEPNNRVELRYLDRARRCERLTGGVPPWSWNELAPLVRDLNALYVNLISGFEIELGDARQLRAGFAGPIYADLHSLLLGRAPNGDRTPRPLATWREWLRCFDSIQVNEDELQTLAGAWGDPWSFAAHAVGDSPLLVVVTLGERGAAYVSSSDLPDSPLQWAERRERGNHTAPLRSARFATAGGAVDGDPTGCGDVWGSTFFMYLLGGCSLDDAIAMANAAAKQNVRYQGASGLFAYLTVSMGAMGPQQVYFSPSGRRC